MKLNLKRTLSMMVLCAILFGAVKLEGVYASAQQTAIVINCNTYSAGLNDTFTGGGSAFSIQAGERVYIISGVNNKNGNLIYYVRTENGSTGYISSRFLYLEPLAPPLQITNATAEKYAGHTDEKFPITVNTNTAASRVVIAYDGTSVTTDMQPDGSYTTWTYPAYMNPGNPRVLTITAYDANNQASAPYEIRIVVTDDKPVSDFQPVWPAPGNHQISTLTKYSNGSAHGTWNGRNKKSAMDITGNAGDEIVAVESGTVTASSYSSSFGYYVKISHEDGSESLYAHMESQSALQVGNTVNVSDNVGYMGSTGSANGTHLHFELFDKNPWLDYYNNPDYVNYVPDLTYTMGAEWYGRQ